MKGKIFILLLILISLDACKQQEKSADVKIVFLHHSTGRILWTGINTSKIEKLFRRVNEKLAQGQLPGLFSKYNKEQNKNYSIEEITFPKNYPYGWNNFPYDYYNIWVKNAGNEPYLEEPTLEMLTKKYDVIIFKHCYPVSNIQPEQDNGDIQSETKTISNYKLQYNALRKKMNEFPDTKFILFTGAVQVQSKINEDEAKRAREFFQWVKAEWDLEGDNIYLWDLYSLQTEGGIYFKDEYAVSVNDSHPNEEFAGSVAELLFNRIVDIIESDGNKTKLTGDQE